MKAVCSPSIFVVILNWNGKNDTLECLDSVSKIVYPNFQTVVVDNGSTDDSVKAIHARFPQIKLLETGTNLGFAEGNNVGIRYALAQGADALLLLNNDTIVDPHLLQGFAEEMQAAPTAGIFGATIYLYGDRDRLDHFGGIWNPQKAAFDFVGHREKLEQTRPLELDYVCGAAMLVKREVFEKIGLLEARFFLIWEEADFCFRARRAGFSSLTCPGAVLWHKVSASFVGKKPHTNYYWWRNRLLWIERNCSLRERVRLSASVLLPEIFHLLKLRLLKEIQLLFTHSEEKRVEKKGKILQYRAALIGARDYIFRRFGEGPAWLFRR